MWIKGSPWRPRNMKFRSHELNMPFFSRPLAKRSTVFAVLLVWIFALGSGVANACLLEAPRQYLHATSASGEHGHAPDALSRHQHDAAGHGDDPGSSIESCLKSCDEGTQTLLKASSGIDHADPGPASLVTTLWTAAAPVTLVFSLTDGLQIPTVGPSFRLRYSRLAL